MEAAKLKQYAITDDVKQTLRQIQPVLQKHLGPILDTFYSGIRSNPALSKFFTDESRFQHARDKQAEHWKRLFSGRFDDEYSASVTRIASVHNRLGLAPGIYIAAYTSILGQLHQALLGHGLKGVLVSRGAKNNTADMITAVDRAVLLDIDLTIEVYLREQAQSHRNQLDKLAGEFEHQISGIVGQMGKACASLRDESTRVTQTASSAVRETTAAAVSSSQTTSNVEAVAAAAEQLANSFNAVNQQVESAAQLGERAVALARNTNTAIDGLHRVTSKIGDVVDIIADIAGQTNLLALNATIEASRAGVAGKGFAVVASEVKALANQTARATGEVATQVQDMRSVVQNVVQAIGEIGTIIDRMRDTSGQVAHVMQEQTDVTASIARNIQDAATGAGLISAVIEQVNRGANVTQKAMDGMLTMSGTLAKQSQELELAARGFVSSLRPGQNAHAALH